VSLVAGGYKTTSLSFVERSTEERFDEMPIVHALDFLAPPSVLHPQYVL